MRKVLILFLSSMLVFTCCQKKQESLYTIGVFQFNDAPTLNAVRDGFIRALEDNGLRDNENIRLKIRSGYGNLPEVQRIAQDFVDEDVNMIVAINSLSPGCSYCNS